MPASTAISGHSEDAEPGRGPASAWRRISRAGFYGTSAIRDGGAHRCRSRVAAIGCQCVGLTGHPLVGAFRPNGGRRRHTARRCRATSGIRLRGHRGGRGVPGGRARRQDRRGDPPFVEHGWWVSRHDPRRHGPLHRPRRARRRIRDRRDRRRAPATGHPLHGAAVADAECHADAPALPRLRPVIHGASRAGGRRARRCSRHCRGPKRVSSPRATARPGRAAGCRRHPSRDSPVRA